MSTTSKDAPRTPPTERLWSPGSVPHLAEQLAPAPPHDEDPTLADDAERRELLDDAIGRAGDRLQDADFSRLPPEERRDALVELEVAFGEEGPGGVEDAIGETIDAYLKAKASHARTKSEARMDRAIVAVTIVAVATFGVLGIVWEPVFGSEFPDEVPDGSQTIPYFVAIAGFVTALVAGFLWSISSPLTTRAEVRAARERMEAAQAAIDTTIDERLLGPLAATIVNQRLGASFSAELREDDPAKFSSHAAAPALTTRSMTKLQEVLDSSPAGAIGICGTRGTGKTTAIERFCKTRIDEHLVAVHVDAPVRFDAVPFLANLYVRVLDEVKSQILEKKTAPGRLVTVRHLVLALVAAAVALAWFAGLASSVPTPDASPLLLLVLVVVVLVVGIALALRRTTRRRRGDSLAGLVADGKRRMTGIATSSTQTTASIPLRGTLASHSRSRQVTESPLALPELRDSYTELAAELQARSIRLRVGVDELDKMSPDDAREFLNSLKAVFGLPNMQFLVSVSEDAMSDFERRGLPLRDAFDSSLDEIVRFDELTVQESIDLLNWRSAAGFPLSFGSLCHCLSGGIPRDLLRTARRLARINQTLGGDERGEMKALCERLVAEDLRGKSAALWTVARNVDAEPYSTRFRRWLDVSDNEVRSPELLLNACRRVTESEPLDLADLPSPEWVPRIELLSSLALEFAGYRYFAATVMVFFSEHPDADLRHSMTLVDSPGGLQTLSRARLAFANDPRLAWTLVSRFREAASLAPVLEVPPEGFVLARPDDTPVVALTRMR